MEIFPRIRKAQPVRLFLWLFCGVLLLVPAELLRARQNQSKLTPQEKAIVKRIEGLRQLPDPARGQATKQLALEIGRLPASAAKVDLATDLATLSTEGDPGGRDTLQQVTTTLSEALAQHPLPARNSQPALSYFELATLVRYEHMSASLKSPQLDAALSLLQKEDESREQANFTLTDLQGGKWTLKDLRGKVVLVNFWATWCPPCRSEMPDLETLYKQFKGRGLVILGIDDEAASKVRPFIRERRITYPILLDPGSKVHKQFFVEGIPISFLYGRDGTMVAEAIDMRTRAQFLAMLAKTGLQ
jgi:peroxiredoxin